MKQPISILVLEGDPPSVGHLESRVTSQWADARCGRVTGLEQLLAAMADGAWDVVLADYAVAGRDMLDAFDAIRRDMPDARVILVTDAANESQARALLDHGVWDFLLKEDLHRLDHLVRHARQESTCRREERASDRARQRSEGRYRQVFLNASDSLFVFPISPDGQPGRFTDVNAAASDMLGYSPEELMQFSPPDLVDARDREGLPAKFHELLTQKHQHVELLLVAKDGRRIPTEISGTLFDLESQPTVLGFVTDVTGKKRAAEMFREARAATIRMHGRRASVDIAIIVSLCFLVLLAYDVFQGFERISALILGYRPLDGVIVALVFLSFSAIVFALRRKREFDLEVEERGRVEDALRTLQGELETRVQRRTHELLESNEALRLEVAERQHVEALLRLQGAVLDASADAIIITDEDGRIAWINPAFTALTGYSAQDSIGRNPGELIKSGVQDAAFYKDLWDTIRSGHAWRGELTNRRKDGSLYSENMTITPVKNAHGAVTHFVAIKRDLTEEKRLKAQFLQAQKMESVGRLAGGIAHDFNNLLTVINGTAELASSTVSEDNPLHADLEEIHRAGNRAAALTRQLLAFSRKQVMKPQVLRLASLVADLRSLMQRMIGEDVNLVIAGDRSQGVVKADPGQIEQVLMNLIVNARDAMPRGGTLTIETLDLDITDPETARRASIQPGPYVLLSVCDTGIGMNEETRARLFEPFFTTKEPGKGTGLGLATVYGIVQQSGGHISVDTATGRGTTFSIYLPRIADKLSVSAPVGSAPVAAGAETILVVEDEPAVCEMARRMLSSAGYVVLTAGNAAEALPMLQRHHGPVNLMLTDVVMPGKSGPELALQVAERYPDTKIIFTSGHTENAALLLSVRDERRPFIGKPYTRDDLLRTVRETLDSPARVGRMEELKGALQ